MALLEAVAAAAAPALTAAALLCGGLALVVTRRPALALGILLDLLLAAGLLRLVGEPSWGSISSAAAVVALRRLIGAGLRLGSRGWSSAGKRGAPSGWLDATRRLLRPAWPARNGRRDPGRGLPIAPPAPRRTPLEHPEFYR